MTDPFEAIKKERKTGKVIAGTTKDAKSVVALATAFGLKGDASLYHQVDAELARQILVNVLHRDLAYGNRLLLNIANNQPSQEALFQQIKEHENGELQKITKDGDNTKKTRVGKSGAELTAG